MIPITKQSKRYYNNENSTKIVNIFPLIFETRKKDIYFAAGAES